MINNDVLRSLRYSLNINDAETLKVFQETDYDVALADLQAWLLPVKLWLSWNMEMLNLK